MTILNLTFKVRLNCLVIRILFIWIDWIYKIWLLLLITFYPIKTNTILYYNFRGQQLAQQMQHSNPEIIESLRRQMGRNPNDSEPSEKKDEWLAKIGFYVHESIKNRLKK